MKTIKKQKNSLKNIPTKILNDILMADENCILVYPTPTEYIEKNIILEEIIKSAVKKYPLDMAKQKIEIFKKINNLESYL